MAVTDTAAIFGAATESQPTNHGTKPFNLGSEKCGVLLDTPVNAQVRGGGKLANPVCETPWRNGRHRLRCEPVGDGISI